MNKLASMAAVGILATSFAMLAPSNAEAQFSIQFGYSSGGFQNYGRNYHRDFVPRSNFGNSYGNLNYFYGNNGFRQGNFGHPHHRQPPIVVQPRYSYGSRYGCNDHAPIIVPHRGHYHLIR